MRVSPGRSLFPCFVARFMLPGVAFSNSSMTPFSFNSGAKRFSLSPLFLEGKLFSSFFNPLTAEWALRALIDFTLSNARRFYSSMENPLDGKGLNLSWRVRSAYLDIMVYWLIYHKGSKKSWIALSNDPVLNKAEENIPPVNSTINESFPRGLISYRIYSNKRRIWDKKVYKRLTPDALTADIFALVIMKLSGFFTAWISLVILDLLSV